MKENKTYKYQVWASRIGGTIDCLWWATLINIVLALFMPALYDETNIGLRLFVVLLTVIFSLTSLEKLFLRPYLETFMYIIFTDEEVPPLIYDDNVDMSEFEDCDDEE